MKKIHPLATWAAALTLASWASAFAEEQHLYAAGDAAAIYKITLDGKASVFAAIGAKGIDMDADGTLWAVNSGGELYCIKPTPDGSPATLENGHITLFADGIKSPLGMAIDPNGDFWIAEHYDGVVKIARATKEKTKINVGGGAYSVERGPNGRMYVSRQNGKTIYEFLPDGTPTKGTKEAPEPFIEGYGNGHRSIVFDLNGDILLLYGAEIARFDARGKYLGAFFKWDGKAAHAGTMTRAEFIARGAWHPMDLAVDQNGTVYSSDNGYTAKNGDKVGGAIYRFKKDGSRELFFETKTRINWMTVWPRTPITLQKNP